MQPLKLYSFLALAIAASAIVVPEVVQLRDLEERQAPGTRTFWRDSHECYVWQSLSSNFTSSSQLPQIVGGRVKTSNKGSDRLNCHSIYNAIGRGICNRRDQPSLLRG